MIEADASLVEIHHCFRRIQKKAVKFNPKALIIRKHNCKDMLNAKASRNCLVKSLDAKDETVRNKDRKK